MATATKAKYRVFDVGKYNEVMPKLKADGLQPATLTQIARGRLDNDISFDIYCDTSSGIAYAQNNQDKFKVLPFSQQLADITPETELFKGAIRLTLEQYKKLQPQEFSRKDIITRRRLTQKEAEDHAGWLALFDGDQEMQEKYVERVFREVRNRYNEREAMGFYIRHQQKDSCLRPVFFDGLYGRSDASDYYKLRDVSARLVGVVCAGEGAEGTAPQAKTYTPEQISRALDNLELSGIEETLLNALKGQR